MAAEANFNPTLGLILTRAACGGRNRKGVFQSYLRSDSDWRRFRAHEPR